MPHTPLFASPAFEGKSKKGVYGDVIMELDWSAGEIIKALKEEGIYENTIFVFTSDNGPAKGSAKPLRGKKAQTWEGGQRVPGIITWPGTIPAGVVTDEFVSTLDLFPTFAQLASTSIPKEIKIDGMDISTFLKNPMEENLPERPFLFYARNGELEAIRLGKWKLHTKKSIGWNENLAGGFEISLYDLENDISEQTNIAEIHPEIVKKLTTIAHEYDLELQ